MSVCVFFGHRDCPETVKETLSAAIEGLIQQGADTFYVGDNGQFDRLVLAALRVAQATHPHIRYAVVLSRLPTAPLTVPTLVPEGVEAAPPRFAIDYRNRWLVKQADWVVCYVDHPWGGAYKFARMAERAGKLLVRLCDKPVV